MSHIRIISTSMRRLWKKIKLSRKLKRNFYWFFVVLLVAGLFFNGYKYQAERNNFNETKKHLAEIADAKIKIVWTNKKELCSHYSGKCYWGDEIPNDTDLDYIIYFDNLIDVKDINNGRFQELINFFESDQSKPADVIKRSFSESAIIEVKNIPQDLLPTLPRFDFVVFGDSQSWPDKGPGAYFEQILEKAAGFNPDLVISVGDISRYNSCREPEKCRPYNEAWRDRVQSFFPGKRIYPAVGNHDLENGALNLWRDVFSLPPGGPDELNGTAYSFDHKNSHFSFFNTEVEEEIGQQTQNSVQVDWLDQDLKSRATKNIFVIGHRPKFPAGLTNDPLQWNIMQNNNVLAYFSGHEHIYCYRKAVRPSTEEQLEENIIHHFTIGNSGSKVGEVRDDCEQFFSVHHFAIVSVRGPEVDVSVYNFHGKKISNIKFYNEKYYSD